MEEKELQDDLTKALKIAVDNFPRLVKALDQMEDLALGIGIGGGLEAEERLQRIADIAGFVLASTRKSQIE